MDSKKPDTLFFKLCYRQYEFEMEETNQIYQRFSFAIERVK